MRESYLSEYEVILDSHKFPKFIHLQYCAGLVHLFFIRNNANRSHKFLFIDSYNFADPLLENSIYFSLIKFDNSKRFNQFVPTALNRRYKA